MVKRCVICDKIFIPIKYASQQKCCSLECTKINIKQKAKEYRKLDKYKAYHRENMRNYRKTETFKIWRKAYYKTDACINTVKKYRCSDKGKLFYRLWNKTAKGKLNRFKKCLKRRARHNHYIEAYTDAEWKYKLEATNGICPGFDIEPHYVGIDKLHRDHIYSIKNASEDFKRTGIKKIYTIDDMQPLCARCNGRKQDKVIDINQKI